MAGSSCGSAQQTCGVRIVDLVVWPRLSIVCADIYSDI
jgi:hypothetical protein